MDKIFIQGLELEVIIGVHPYERNNKQAILLDLELGTDISLASVGDSLSKTIDYDQLIKQVKICTLATQFLLIETLAEHIAKFILQSFPIPWLRLCLTKPGAAISAQKVGVIIERSAA